MLDRIGGDLQTNNTWRNTIDGAVDFINDNVLQSDTVIEVHAVNDVRVSGHWTKTYTADNRALNTALKELPRNQNKRRIYVRFQKGTLESPAVYNFDNRIDISRFHSGEIFVDGDTDKVTKGVDNKVVINHTLVTPPTDYNAGDMQYFTGFTVYNCKSVVYFRGMKQTVQARYGNCIKAQHSTNVIINYVTFENAAMSGSDRLLNQGYCIRAINAQLQVNYCIFGSFDRAIMAYDGSIVKQIQNEDIVTLKRKYDHVTAEINDLTSQIDALPDGSERDELIAKRTTKQEELNKYAPSTFASDIARPQYGSYLYGGTISTYDSNYSGLIVGTVASDYLSQGAIKTPPAGISLDKTSGLARSNRYINISSTDSVSDIKQKIDLLPKNQNGYDYFIRFGYNEDGQKQTGSYVWDFGNSSVYLEGFNGGRVFVYGDQDLGVPGDDGEGSRFTIKCSNNDYNGAFSIVECNSFVKVESFKFIVYNREASIESATASGGEVTLTLEDGHGFSRHRNIYITVNGLTSSGGTDPNVNNVVARATSSSSGTNTFKYTLEGATDQTYTVGSATVEQLNHTCRPLRNVRSLNTFFNKHSFNSLNAAENALNTRTMQAGIIIHDGNGQVHDCRFNNCYIGMLAEYKANVYIEDCKAFSGTPHDPAILHKLPSYGTFSTRGADVKICGSNIDASHPYYASGGGIIGNKPGLIWEEMFARKNYRIDITSPDDFSAYETQKKINNLPKVQSNYNHEIRFQPGPTKAITAASLTSNVVTVTAPNHGFSTNDEVYINRYVHGDTSPLGKQTITVTDSNNFTFPLTGTDEVYDIDTDSTGTHVGTRSITSAEILSNGMVEIEIASDFNLYTTTNDRATITGLSYTGSVNPNVTDVILTRSTSTKYKYRATSESSGVTAETFGVSGATITPNFARVVKPFIYDLAERGLEFYGFNGGDVTLKVTDFVPDPIDGRVRDVDEFRTNEGCYRTIITGYRGGWNGLIKIDDGNSEFFIRDLHLKIRNDDSDNYVDNQECVLARSASNLYTDNCQFTGVGYTASGGNTYNDSVGIRASRMRVRSYGCWFSNLKVAFNADDMAFVYDDTNNTFEDSKQDFSYPALARVAQNGGMVLRNHNNSKGTEYDSYVSNGIIFPEGGVILGDASGNAFGTSREDATGITRVAGRAEVLPE